MCTYFKKIFYFNRKPIVIVNPDALEILESEDCSIAEGVREAVEVTEYYF